MACGFFINALIDKILLFYFLVIITYDPTTDT